MEQMLPIYLYLSVWAYIGGRKFGHIIMDIMFINGTLDEPWEGLNG